MCTPQLRNQAAALQGAANPNLAVPNANAASSVNSSPRLALATAPFSDARLFQTAPVNAGLLPGTTSLSQVRPDFSQTASPAVVVSPVRQVNQGLSLVGKLIDNQRPATPATRQAPPVVAARAGALPDFDETHAPTPQALAEAAIKTRNVTPDTMTFEPPTKETRPFILADRGGYLTRDANRAWLMGVEQMMKTTDPYPSGTPGRGGSSRARSAARVWVGYLYTLPEVKALLDTLSATEGSVHDGYLTSHYPNPPLKDFSTFSSGGPRGRYQIEPYGNELFGANWYSRKDFGPMTQDLIAITLLVKDGAIDKLLAGDLRGAFSAAARTFSSVPMGATEDYSGYVGKNWNPTAGPNADRQPTGAKFDALPGIFLARLNSRRTEFRDAQTAWEKSRTLPWAFISPFRWHNFGLSGF
jgi:muramidase (phage lysozyme)